MRSNIGGVVGDGMDMHRPVWVKLAALSIRRPDARAPEQPPRNSLDMTAETSGLLQQWLRTSTGEWIGIVDYEVPFANNERKPLWLEGQLVPAYALRPRKYGGG